MNTSPSTSLPVPEGWRELQDWEKALRLPDDALVLFEYGVNQARWRMCAKRGHFIEPREQVRRFATQTPVRYLERPKDPRNVLITEKLETGISLWICDVTKLDELCPVQARYKKLVLEAVERMNVGTHEERAWVDAGTRYVAYEKWNSWPNGRPPEVCHARMLPPCQIDAYIIFDFAE